METRLANIAIIVENALWSVRWETSNLLTTSLFGEIIVLFASDATTLAPSTQLTMTMQRRAKVNISSEYDTNLGILSRKTK